MKRWIFLMTLITFMAAPLSATQAQAEATTYQIDTVHSTLGFAVTHLTVSTVRGKFNEFEGSITYDPENMENFDADVTIQAASIDTDNQNRDDHLRSADFFEVETYPVITFANARLKEVDGKTVIFGDLTIKDVTKTVTIPVEIKGPVAGMGGGQVIGIKGETTINRQDFNITWNKQLDEGGLVVGNNVDLIVEIEAKAE